jgi:DNA-binding MarR family transcriptional regulator
LRLFDDDPDDKRGRLLTLTPDGKRSLARAVPIWKRTHAEVETHLAEGGADPLRGKLRTRVTSAAGLNRARARWP